MRLGGASLSRLRFIPATLRCVRASAAAAFPTVRRWSWVANTDWYVPTRNLPAVHDAHASASAELEFPALGGRLGPRVPGPSRRVGTRAHRLVSAVRDATREQDSRDQGVNACDRRSRRISGTVRRVRVTVPAGRPPSGSRG